MAAVTSQSIVNTGTTPSPITPSASDTIAATQFGPNGAVLRVITTGTSTNVGVLDSGLTASGNPAAGSPPQRTIAAPSTGVRMVLVPLSAIDPVAQFATVTFSGALTGVTYELYRI